MWNFSRLPLLRSKCPAQNECRNSSTNELQLLLKNFACCWEVESPFIQIRQGASPKARMVGYLHLNSRMQSKISGELKETLDGHFAPEVWLPPGRGIVGKPES